MSADEQIGRALLESLRRAGVADADASRSARSLYAADASLYRVEPLAVVRPRDADEVIATLATCRESEVPITARGAGTSIAGNAIGPGVVIDFSRHMHRIVTMDPEARTAVVEPGVVLSQLQRAAAAHGLRFGPDPSTHNRATIGGMVGNNACGTRALGFGRTSDNVRALDVVDGTGRRRVVGRGIGDPVSGLAELVGGNLGTLRTEFGRFNRQVSGYGLEHLLPERGGDLARALVGSEGTLAVVLGATLDLVAAPEHRVLVVLGYPDIATAADAVPAVVEHGPVACEGFDARIVDIVRAKGVAVPELPSGRAWLLVELAGDDGRMLEAAAAELVATADSIDALVIADQRIADRIWRIREDGAGLSSRNAAGLPCYPGWEDAAVPPERLGAYLRDFERLLADRSLAGLPYGHFGDGCLHIRIDFPFRAPDGTARFSEFMIEAADLVSTHGGSLSGEHGDGRTRSALLSRMYSPEALALMSAVKALFDPDALLNPGIIVDPQPLTAALRHERPTLALRPGFGYRNDHGGLASAVHRCNGVGKCRSVEPGGSMCPSYRATHEERDSTRGRARALQDAITGRLGGWGSPELESAMDLCLGCKACASECPTGVDMATYRSEYLSQRYSGRVRPRAHYTLGRLPSWLALGGRAPVLANAALKMPPVLREWVGGIDRRRRLPALAPKSFRRQFESLEHGPGDGEPVEIFVDPFTDHFAPQIGVAAARILARAGYHVRLSPPEARCALTLISTGQLVRARRVVEGTVATLVGTARSGTPIVGLEPSSTAVLRSDIQELLPGSDAKSVSDAVVTLAELLMRTPGWRPPDLTGRQVVVQPHCHHEAVLGWDADADLLGRTGAAVRRVAGCCGMAGDWGLAPGHREVSVAVAGLDLLPALRHGPRADVLADGFSCRTQIADLTGRPVLHLAELFDGALVEDAAAAEG